MSEERIEEKSSELNALLTAAVNQDASDIFLIPGMPAAFKIHGQIEPIDERKILPGEMDHFIRAIYALTGGPLLVDAVAAEDCEILAIRLGALLGENHAGASWQGKLLRNLVSIFAGKNRALSHRIFCTSPKTIRGRLVTYLSAQALEQGSSSFSIPFDRQQLADYLGVDRSALSKELGRMRDEGLLETRKNHFLLHRLGEGDS